MKRLVWVGVVAVLVLAARWLAYALAAPSPLANRLEASTGGPSLVIVTLVALGLAAAVSVFVVWLAAVGVRERHRLEPERVRPALRLRRLALRAALLYAASAVAFAGFESYLHWRDGLGFHGLSCLVGPVHRNASPLLAALSLAASAIAEAAQHVVAWMRAVLRALASCPFVFARLAESTPLVSSFAPALLHTSLARAPPAPA